MTAPVQFPNPAMVETTYRVTTDPVTDTEEDRVRLQPVGGLVAGLADTGGWSVGWDEDGGDYISGVILTSVEDQGDWIVGVSDNGQAFRFRDLDPYDAVTMSAAGVPQPLSVVQAEVIRGGVLASQLDAVVAPDNTVATLMLETGLGTYVRYAGDWQLLSSDTGALEDMSLVAVGAAALDVWDAADAASHTISVFDLPVPSADGPDIDPTTDVDVETTAAIAASGVQIPQIVRTEDLDLGIRYANTHPAARWYVTKRARALSASARIPAHWNVAPVAVTPPFSMAGREMEM
ncbi:hypothetical protein [Longimicrobium sp.]|jgi:hypothetical protein|uniref:hypothetical protein n=1 Tax=Longimicrobium sp. TaxID=2029185 RepID=UPI002ED88AB0